MIQEDDRHSINLLHQSSEIRWTENLIHLKVKTPETINEH